MSVTTSVQRAGFGLYRRMRQIVGRHRQFLFLFGFDPRLRKLIVTGQTELLIEGYPRSANSFALHAFLSAQKETVRVASHLHLSGQCQVAFCRKIPSLILIRNPQDAVASFMILEGNKMSPQQALREYITFYRDVLPHRDRFVLASFEEVTTNFGRVIERVNERFRTEFGLFVHTDANVEVCYRQMDATVQSRGGRQSDVLTQSARPVPERRDIKERVMKELFSNRPSGLLKEAQTLYSQLMGKGN